jgi:hypothetical protein
VVFHDVGGARSRPGVVDLARWLTERGEPHEVGSGHVALRGVPAGLVVSPNHPIQAELSIGPRTLLSRLVGLLFDLSVWLGTDVRLGDRDVTRAGLWLRLADEQDRLRLVAALARGDERGNREEVLQRLWAVIAELRPGHDDRWDVARERIVELVEVGEEMSVEAARLHDPQANAGDAVPVPVDAALHIAAWRWMVDAWPGLAEGAELGSAWPR